MENKYLPIALDSAPEPQTALEYLRSRPQWLVWRYVLKPGADKRTKPPFSAKTGRQCSATDPDNWAPYGEAVEAAKAGGFDGIGYALSADDGLTGIDLDECRNPASGKIEAWAKEVLDLAETYAEISPSGTGLRLFVHGKVDHATKDNRAGIEIYASNRYMTVTGNHVAGTPEAIQPAPRTIAALLARVERFRGDAAAKARPDGAGASAGVSGASGATFWRRVNDAALADLKAWVPALFPSAIYQAGTKAYRVTSADLGRGLEEDLSIAPGGIVDFGLHDMGDVREGKRTPIDLVLFYAPEVLGLAEGEATQKDAAFWLCERLGVEPANLGWEEAAPVPTAAEAFGSTGSTSSTGDANVFDPWAPFIVPPFPLDVLPDDVAHFVDVNARYIGGDRSALAMCVLGACSGAVDHRWSLRMKQHGPFSVSPRLWVMLVGDPSSRKSPLMRAAMAPLRNAESDLWRKYRVVQSPDYKSFFGEYAEEAVEPNRLIASDTTSEALGQILSTQDRGILVFRDEIAAWIGSMEKYAGGRGSAADRGFWLQAFDGGPFSVDRVGRGALRIENLSCSLLGGIQPERLGDFRGFQSDGLLQRFLPVMLGDSRFGADIETGHVDGGYRALVGALLDAAPTKISMTAHAIGAMAELHRWIGDVERETRGFYSGYQGFIGKLVGLSGSLALLLHLMADPKRAETLSVGVDTVEAVTRLVRSFIVPHGFAFYRTVEGTAADGDRLTRIASWLLTARKDRIVASDLTTNIALCRGKTLREINDMVSPLEAGGWIAPETRGLAKAWRVNSAVFKQFEARAAEEERRKQALAEVMNSPRRVKSA